MTCHTVWIFTLYMLLLGDIIRKYSVSFICYADNSLYLFATRRNIPICKTKESIVDIKKRDDE